MHFPGVALRDLGLAASEGHLTIPVEDGCGDGVLAVHTAFFEFVAGEDIEDTAPPTRLCHELRDGRRNYVVVTGANGLYVDASRYDLLVELPPAGCSDGRLSRFAEAFDQALSEVNVEHASKRASGRLRPPRLHLMRGGWSERACRREFAQGRRDVRTSGARCVPSGTR